MSSENFGEATYVCGRHRKNPVLIYTSRRDRNKVYEFMIATKYKIPGLVSWKCVSCSKVKNGYRNLGAELKRKVPLILVDNDIIKEDPERPLNAEHFCNGKDAVDAVLDRARMEFVHRHGNEEPNSAQIRETIHHFAKEAASSTPIPLNFKEKRIVQRTLDAKCLPLLHGVNKRRRCKQRKEAIEDTFRREDGEHLESLEDQSTSTDHHEEEAGLSSRIPRRRREECEELECPRKRVRRISKLIPHPLPVQQPLIVRPLPPYYFSRSTATPQIHLRPHQRNNTQNAMEYYDSVVDEVEHDLDNEELISGDQQQVAFSIEL